METGRGVSRDDRAPRPRPAVHRGHGGDEPGRAARLARAARREGARRLEVSVDTVRAKGAEWGIEVYLGEGLYRYDPAQVEALRQRRRRQPIDPVSATHNRIA